MTRKLPLLVAFACALGACRDGDLGAVSFRWRIVDKTTGQYFDPRDQSGENASCVRYPNVGIAENCATGGWWVQNVRLVVTDPVTRAPAPLDDDLRVEFNCREREATTQFRIPLARWALSIEVRNPPEPACGPTPTTPPPVVRDVRKGEIVSLDILEIAVDPPPVNVPAPADGGVDASNPF